MTAGQDAPPTGLVLYGFPYNPYVVLLYKVELRCTNRSKSCNTSYLIRGAEESKDRAVRRVTIGKECQ